MEITVLALDPGRPIFSAQSLKHLAKIARTQLRECGLVADLVPCLRAIILHP